MTARHEPAFRANTTTFLFAGFLGVAALWSYWTTLAAVASRWADDPQYSHGYLVPVFALYLLWQRRGCLNGRAGRGNWLGVGLLALAVGLRLAGAYCRFDYLDQISLLPACGGLFFLAGGWSALSWAWPAIAFLAFMVPLPHSVSVALSAPMQSFATNVSTFCLQVVGLPAIAEGNVILLNDIELGIVEACSGLRMLVVFFALSTAVAMLITRPIWEKFLIAASAVPIALASNVLRITITGVCYEFFGNHFGGALFHDVAGWLMMPLGLMFLGLELWILRKLLIERPMQAAPLAPQQIEAANPLAIYRTAAQSPRRERKLPKQEPVPVQV